MPTITPDPMPRKGFTDPEEAWTYIDEIYRRNTSFIRQHLADLAKGGVPEGRVRAYYPSVEVTSTSYGKTDSTLPYGYLHTPGIYRTTITAPDLFRNYLIEQFTVILKNHGGTIEVGESGTPIPLHFAVRPNERLDGEAINALGVPLRDLFDAPDLAHADDEIANGTFVPPQGGPYPLSVFTAMFLHGSWLHLLGNMLFLYIFGNNIEDRLGHVRFTLFYLVCGYAAAYGYALVNESSGDPLIGASGAIAGVLGAYLVLYPKARVWVLVPFLIFLPLRLPAWLVLGFWFVLQAVYSSGGGVSAAGP